MSRPAHSPVRQQRRSTNVLALFAIALSCVAFLPFFGQIADAAYIVTIPGKDEQCFIVRSPGAAGGTLYGNFDHLNDDVSAEPVSVVIIDVKEEHVLFRSRRRASEGVFRVNLKPDQKVNLCLQNGIVTAGRGRKSPSARTHDGKDRVIGFEYSVEPRDENKDIHTQNERNQKQAWELQRAFGNLINHHQFMRTREGKHRDVVEKTFTALMWWSVLESVTVIGIAVLQIMYFRNFLERRRYL